MNYTLLIVFITVQLYVFMKTQRRLHHYVCLFPFDKIDDYELNGTEIVIPNKCSSEFKEIVSASNKYLEKNDGTADFNILKDIAERRIGIVWQDASVNLSFPMYIGLLGTFLGIGLGVFNLNINETSGSGISSLELENINTFLGGVGLAMLSSFSGLIMTIWSNSTASSCRGKLERKKDVYFSFLQIYLIPEMGCSIAQAMANLKNTIGGFEKSFIKVIDKFETAFSSMADSFDIGFQRSEERCVV